MKAEELRIGNLVSYDERIGTIQWFMNKSFSLKMEFSTLKVSSRKGWAELPFEPIPLTEQWLLDFGFTPTKKGEGWFDYKISNTFYVSINVNFGVVAYSNDNDSYKILEGRIINKVHDLQNFVYTLTGIELKIKQ